jgi:peroxiredoxin
MTFKLADTALLATLIASVGLNIVQMRTVNRLHAENTLAAGATIPSLVVADATGTRVDLALTGSQPTVLYVFSPQCGWCDANKASIEALSRQARGRYRVVGLSLTDNGLAAHLSNQPFSFPVYRNPTPDAVAAYRLDATPQTILLSPDGRVERVWQGAYAGRQHASIQAYFDVELPEVSASSY